jgi:drug/metabolite transporter (DMT)-like permease
VDSVRRPAATTTHARRGWGTKFLLLALIWGLSFLFIKLGEERLAALHVALGRMLTGTATLAVILAVRRERLPAGWRTWGHLVVAGLLLNAVPFSLLAYGEQHVSSVVAGIWNATTPLFTLPVAVALIAEERLTRQRAIGLLIGLAGVLTVLGIWRGHGATSIEGNLLCLGSAVSYGFGFPYARRFLASRPDSPLGLAAGQLICGTAALAILTPFLTTGPGTLTAGVLASVLTLGAFGTGIAYILNYSIIRDAGATVASTVTYIIPIFSTLAGIIFLTERLTWYQPLGAAVILLGAAIAQERLHQCSRGSTRRSPVADATSLEPSLTDR